MHLIKTQLVNIVVTFLVKGQVVSILSFTDHTFSAELLNAILIV